MKMEHWALITWRQPPLPMVVCRFYGGCHPVACCLAWGLISGPESDRRITAWRPARRVERTERSSVATACGLLVSYVPLARTASNARYCAAAGHVQRLWLWNSSNHSLVAARGKLEGLRYQGQQLRAAPWPSALEMDRQRGDDRRMDRYDRRRDERSIDRLRARGYDRPAVATAAATSRRPRDDDRGARDRRGDERRRGSRDDDERRPRTTTTGGGGGARRRGQCRRRGRGRGAAACARRRPRAAARRAPGLPEPPPRGAAQGDDGGAVPAASSGSTIDRVELNAERSFGFVTYAHAAMVDAVLATRMHQFEHAEHQTSFVEVRRPKPRGNQF